MGSDPPFVRRLCVLWVDIMWGGGTPETILLAPDGVLACKRRHVLDSDGVLACKRRRVLRAYGVLAYKRRPVLGADGVWKEENEACSKGKMG